MLGGASWEAGTPPTVWVSAVPFWDGFDREARPQRALKMFGAFRAAAAAILGLETCAGVFSPPLLPIGGSHIGQTGVVFAVVFIACEALKLWKEWKQGRKEKEH